MKIKKYLLVTFTWCFLGGGFGLAKYNSSHSKEINDKVHFSLSADELITAFKENVSEANATYLNKKVQISGTVQSYSINGQNQNILLKTNDIMASISCDMSKIEPSLKSGDHVQIIGKYTSYLLDVEFTGCELQK